MLTGLVDELKACEALLASGDMEFGHDLAEAAKRAGRLRARVAAYRAENEAEVAVKLRAVLTGEGLDVVQDDLDSTSKVGHAYDADVIVSAALDWARLRGLVAPS